MNKNFKLIEGSNPNYLAYICEIKELHNIEGANALLKTIVLGYDVVVSNKTKVGDIIIYFPVESSINLEFLSANNLFELSQYKKNLNANEIEKIIEEIEKHKEDGKIEENEQLIKEAKSHCGFFGKHGRVRCLTLRGCPSQGFVIPVESLLNWKPNLNLNDLEFNEPFNEIDGELFVKKYTPIIVKSERNNINGNNSKKLKRFDRIIPEQFAFHYDTNMLNNNIHKYTPSTEIIISRKLHGTSGVFCNILCRKNLTIWEKIKNFLGFKVIMFEYDNIYSSRGVIKNRYINSNINSYYDVDVWGYVSDKIKDYIPQNMSIYGEIVGYIPNTNKFIQKNHDFGCQVGQCKFMPYRITMNDEFGNKIELPLRNVQKFTLDLLYKYPNEFNDFLLPLEIVYEGEFKYLYPEILIDENWHQNILTAMKIDERFYMELPEPLCNMFKEDIRLIQLKIKNGNYTHNEMKKLEKELESLNKLIPPAEGIIIRTVDVNLMVGANKLKTQRHYEYNKISLDNGEVDIETIESENE